ncbi:MAG: hypothetical protein EZS28_004734 [Streblomastix strix]|uniref:Uracil-DNA glycosylase-like domain-containing protein n=1 Tax=Streblomastix strix TaxID=222440 RepID=A0A5J4WZH5_9EUKA|nr:MAG: hypothetical protein EZS28_004734 [Streblomastix strix]
MLQFFTPKRSERILSVAEKVQAMDDLKKKCLLDLELSLRESAKSLCFGDGNCNARIVFIGESPGRDEDTSGTCFVGPSGKLLNIFLVKIQLQRSAILPSLSDFYHSSLS